MALLRIKSTFLQTEEFVCSRLVQSPHSFTNRGGWVLYVELWEGFSVLGKGSYGNGFEYSYLFIAEAVDLGWIMWISRLNSVL